MSAFIDARAVPSGQVIRTDLAIVGGGPAGIALALMLAETKAKMVLLESGDAAFDAKTQSLYRGTVSGDGYMPLDTCRLRGLGGSSNRWDGWGRPLDAADLETRDALSFSGWPLPHRDLRKYLPRAQTWCEAGPPLYERMAAHPPEPDIALGDGALATDWLQRSRSKQGAQPTRFGKRYATELKRIKTLRLYLNANVTGLRLAHDGNSLRALKVATLNGRRFTVMPKLTVLAAGGLETPRLLLASNTQRPAGIGNEHDMVGRFFADHPCLHDIATLVLFDGRMPDHYLADRITRGAVMRAALAPHGPRRLGAQIMVERRGELDDFGKAAVAVAATTLGVDAAHAAPFALGGMLEPAPDPDRRLTLEHERDALGMPRLKLHMRINDADFAALRQTLGELGRQLLAARAGILRLNHKTRDQWLERLGWGKHHMGTTRMHADPKQGVVDEHCKVHGIANLYIAGSSVFPTYGAVGPTLSLIALAARLADRLKGILE